MWQGLSVVVQHVPQSTPVLHPPLLSIDRGRSLPYSTLPCAKTFAWGARMHPTTRSSLPHRLLRCAQASDTDRTLRIPRAGPATGSACRSLSRQTPALSNVGVGLHFQAPGGT